MCSEIRHCVPGTHMCFYDLCLLPVVRLECELVGFSHFVHTHTCTHPLTHYPHTHKLTQNPHTHKHTQNPHPTTQTPTLTQNPHTQTYTHTCTRHLPLPWLLLGEPPSLAARWIQRVFSLAHNTSAWQPSAGTGSCTAEDYECCATVLMGPPGVMGEGSEPQHNTVI